MEVLIQNIYWYCTDFCIHAANVLGITYVEFNFWLFIVVFPSTFLILALLNIRRYIFLPLIKKRKKSPNMNKGCVITLAAVNCNLSIALGIYF